GLQNSSRRRHCVVSNSILKAESLEKSFLSGDRMISVLKSVCLEVSPGESVSIQGESGSGKSTLLNILAGLETMDKGQLYWEGDEISSARLDTLAERRSRLLSMVFQSFYLVPELSALENVLLGARIAKLKIDSDLRGKAAALMERTGLNDRGAQLVTTLSGGERQRVAIARSMLVEPKIILADEPTGNLDERTGDRVMEMLLGLCKETNTSLLLVTHNSEYAKQTDRKRFLKEGELQED
ncbi:MAG: ABC transporter ATP-binding protein, partial [Verrucomicrobiota bacterium]